MDALDESVARMGWSQMAREIAEQPRGQGDHRTRLSSLDGAQRRLAFALALNGRLGTRDYLLFGDTDVIESVGRAIVGNLVFQSGT